MARSSSALPVVLLALAALFVAPPSCHPLPHERRPRPARPPSRQVPCCQCSRLSLPWPRTDQAHVRKSRERRAGHMLSCEDYMMPPSWPFLVVFLGGAFALLVAGNFIFPGEKK